MSPQQSIAHYRVVAKLGEGGMGAVYRATDTKLNRDVAIKVLPDTFAADPERMARFQREAQVLASLNHPGIAAIYGVEDRALILELVEGSTLADRIAHGPIPLDEALLMASQIAEALHYAHDRGIVHRDLKPANIKIGADSRVKVLDFGLAKALSSESPAGDPEASPTRTLGDTRVGALLGTAAYMSPEQARGQAVDRRTDIWAFGAVLHEMLTGRRLFGEPTISDTLAAVLKSDIDFTPLPTQVRPVIERCLRRDPRERWHCVGDAGAALQDLKPLAAVPPGTPRQRTPWIVAAALLAVGLVIAGVGWWRAAAPVEHPLTRFNVDLGPDAMAGISSTVTISPDGRRLVFLARGPNGKPQLATRLLDQAGIALLAGTEGAQDPFFSPDSQSVGFFAENQLKKTSVQGGVPVTLASGSLPRGADWGADGDIIAALTQLTFLSRVSSAGGAPKPISKLAGDELTHRWPQTLPGGKSVLFTAASTNVGMEDARVEALSLNTGQAKVLQRAAYYGRYLPSGHLVYVHKGVLYGARFDLDRLEIHGKPVPVIQDLAADANLGGGQFTFSTAAGTGIFAYVPGKGSTQRWQVAWLESSGKTVPVISTPGLYATLRLSPDGRKLAYYDGADIFVRDLERDTATPLTFNGNGRTPIWAPDGKHVVYTIISGGTGLYWARSNGSSEPVRILDTQAHVFASSFTPDGRILTYYDIKPEGGGDLWTLPLDIADPDHPIPGKPQLFLSLPTRSTGPRISPDGRWVAYTSQETGRAELYVRPFPTGGGKWLISNEGASYPMWSSHDRRLFYETAEHRIMAVDYTIDGDAFVPGKPRLWLDKQIFYLGTQNLDLEPDGKRFVILTDADSGGDPKGSAHITVLLNFFDELRRRIP